VEPLGEPTISRMPYRTVKDAEGSLREIADSELELQVGVMVPRPAHEKARSIKHCCQLAGLRRMSVERKYDGEDCQIHIDLNKPRN
jgi:DNA ligase 4